MPSFVAIGRLHEKYDDQQVSEKFRKREFVLEIQDGQYPQQIKLQLTQNNCDLLDPYQVGEEVEVTFNLRGRPSVKNGQTLYFTNLEAWKIQRAGGAAPAQSPRPAAQPATRPQPQPIASDDDNDLPF